ncbi:MAG TPA: 50S ribosomal protein L11 methyltransferase [Nevskiales bacterium]|nr:50S ribosomal protein L11 methyltransferase [Nevskiales bacterium]
MDWLQIAIEADADVEALEEALLALGAVSVSLTNATGEQLFEPLPGETPLWARCWVTGLFPAATEPASVLFGVQARLGLERPPRFRVETLADRDWVRACLADLKPMRFGRRLWICPSGHNVSEADAVVVQLDPGLAFGTGTHPSTALCLNALDALDLAGKTVIDYGCGSGILAVAAALLGARHVSAVDIDPQAVQATRDNAERNGVSARVQAMPAAAFTPAPADLLVANILSGPLKALAPRFAACVRPGGGLVLAGLLAAEAEDLRCAYAPWFDLPQAQIEDGWLRLSGTRRSHPAPG